VTTYLVVAAYVVAMVVTLVWISSLAIMSYQQPPQVVVNQGNGCRTAAIVLADHRSHRRRRDRRATRDVLARIHMNEAARRGCPCRAARLKNGEGPAIYQGETAGPFTRSPLRRHRPPDQ
jgi:hypothetical protein